MSENNVPSTPNKLHIRNPSHSSSMSSPLRPDLFNQLVNRPASSEKDDIKLAAEIGNSLLKYSKELENELENSANKNNHLINHIKDLEEQLSNLQTLFTKTNESQKVLQNRLWSFEMMNQENLSKIDELEDLVNKRTSEIREKTHQNSKLSQEIEKFVMNEQSHLKKQSSLENKYESEITSLKRVLSEIQKDNLDLKKIVDDYSYQLTLYESKASPKTKRMSSDSPKTSVDVDELIAAYEKEIAALKLEVENAQAEQYETHKLLNESRELIENMKEEREPSFSKSLSKQSSAMNLLMETALVAETQTEYEYASNYSQTEVEFNCKEVQASFDMKDATMLTDAPVYTSALMQTEETMIKPTEEVVENKLVSNECQTETVEASDFETQTKIDSQTAEIQATVSSTSHETQVITVVLLKETQTDTFPASEQHASIQTCTVNDDHKLTQTEPQTDSKKLDDQSMQTDKEAEEHKHMQTETITDESRFIQTESIDADSKYTQTDENSQGFQKVVSADFQQGQYPSNSDSSSISVSKSSIADINNVQPELMKKASSVETSQAFTFTPVNYITNNIAQYKVDPHKSILTPIEKEFGISNTGLQSPSLQLRKIANSLAQAVGNMDSKISSPAEIRRQSSVTPSLDSRDSEATNEILSGKGAGQTQNQDATSPMDISKLMTNENIGNMKISSETYNTNQNDNISPVDVSKILENELDGDTKSAYQVQVKDTSTFKKFGTFSFGGKGKAKRSKEFTENNLESLFKSTEPSSSSKVETGTNENAAVVSCITNMMAGTWMYKYPRKKIYKLMGSGVLELRKLHKRYFWINPFTKTILWGDSDPEHCRRSKSAVVLSMSIEMKKLPKTKDSGSFSTLQQDNSSDSITNQVDITQLLETETVIKSTSSEDREIMTIVLQTKTNNKKEELCIIPLSKFDQETWTTGLGLLVSNQESSTTNQRFTIALQ